MRRMMNGGGKVEMGGKEGEGGECCDGEKWRGGRERAATNRGAPDGDGSRDGVPQTRRRFHVYFFAPREPCFWF